MNNPLSHCKASEVPEQVGEGVPFFVGVAVNEIAIELHTKCSAFQSHFQQIDVISMKSLPT